MPHNSPITCVDYHPASDLTVSGSYDGTVIGWNDDGSQRWSTEFDDLVNDVRISPSGTQVAVAAADRFAFILDAETGHRVELFGPHGDDVNAVRWSPDGNRLACVMDHLDTAIRIWERHAAGWVVRVLRGHESGIFAVAFDPSGTRLATVAEDSTARIWDIESGAQLHVLQHPGDPEALDWSPDGTVIVTGCDDGVARVWDADTGEMLRELHDAGAAVRFIRFETTGSRALVGAYDATMRVYDCSTWAVTETLSAPFQWERTGSFTRHGIVVGSFGAAPLEHSSRAQRNLQLTFGINTIAVTKSHLLVGRDDGRVVDVLRGNIVARHDTIVNTVAVSPDGRVVASGDYRGCVKLTPFADAVDSPVATRAADGGPINSLVWHPSGELFFSGGYDGAIRTWSRSGTCTSTVAAHHGPIKSLAWSSAANLLVAGSSDGSVSGWRDGLERWRSDAEGLVLVNAVACADEAGTIITASRDLQVRIWDAASGALLDTLPAGHLKSVKAVAVSADGTTIITGSYDGTAIIWRRSMSGWSWQVLRLHAKPGVPAVALGNGNLFTAGWNGTVGCWSLDGDLTANYNATLIH